MKKIKELNEAEIKFINGGKGLNQKQWSCLKNVGGDMFRYGSSGAVVGGVGGAVIGANIGLVTGGVKCAWG